MMNIRILSFIFLTVFNLVFARPYGYARELENHRPDNKTVITKLLIVLPDTKVVVLIDQNGQVIHPGNGNSGGTGLRGPYRTEPPINVSSTLSMGDSSIPGQDPVGSPTMPPTGSPSSPGVDTASSLTTPCIDHTSKFRQQQLTETGVVPSSSGLEDKSANPSSQMQTSGSMERVQTQPTGSPDEKSPVTRNESEPGPSGPELKFQGLGVTYAAFRDDGKCKSPEDVMNDFKTIDANGFDNIRSYGVECNQVPNMLKAARQYKKKLFLGVHDIKNVDKELGVIIEATKKNWADIVGISIGNEEVFRALNEKRDATAAAKAVITALKRAREILAKEKYTKGIVTVDEVGAVLKHPELCLNSDFCAVNAHPFFNLQLSGPGKSGRFVLDQVNLVKDRMKKERPTWDKPVIIMESGWPHGGNRGSPAALQPNAANQKLALDSLKSAFLRDNKPNGELYLFSAFDEKWKPNNPQTAGVEKFWGVIKG
ncbi:hypothetical protein FQN57_006979 [Myotisia sp. PD_48]|nr:hypothetical protein FQN57_006979 [Myotisia sp. PD_48]